MAFREEVISRRTKHLLGKARDRAHILVGLAIAVANIDEVIRLIRTAPDPNAARDALMARDWPAADVAPLMLLIDDPRHRITPEGTARLSAEQAKAILDKGHDQALETLRANRHRLDALVEALLRTETLDAADAYRAAGVPYPAEPDLPTEAPDVVRR